MYNSVMNEKRTDLGTYDKQLANQQEQFLQLLESVGLPSKNIFVPVSERAVVFQNAHALLDKISDESRSHAAYISKFFAAVAGGLFDAALNYIWDETVLHLRMRIEAYDLEYFYEIAASEDKRKDLKTIEDISKLTDDELLRGSLKIELISETGFRNIDLVRYMRNNASAAHPNQTAISGLKLVSMAEDCLRWRVPYRLGQQDWKRRRKALFPLLVAGGEKALVLSVRNRTPERVFVSRRKR